MSLFARNVKGMTDNLQRRIIGVAGCGGLGSNAAVALVRAGVGRLVIADFDRVEISNLNRQHFFQNDLGQEKANVLAKHLKAINPNVKVDAHVIRLTPENTLGLFKNVDLMIEAFDQADAKKWLIETWCRAFPQRHLICGNGISGYGETDALHVLRAGSNLWFCGDGKTEMAMGLCSARVSLVASMQANLAIELLMKEVCS